MYDPLIMHHKVSLAYKLVVAGMTLSAMNSFLERLGVPHQPIEQKDLVVSFVWPWWPDAQNQDEKPMLPVANFQTTNFMFVFREGKLLSVVNMQTNSEQVQYYDEWAKLPSLIGSNEAYHIATNWLSRLYVDVPLLNQKYNVSVSQPGFWTTPPARWGEAGSGWTNLPLYFVTWNKGDYEAARVGIFGPTKQLTGLIIGDRDKGFDPSICSHVYLRVTNEEELLAMTNVPMRMEATNRVPIQVETNHIRGGRYPPPKADASEPR